MQDCCGPAHNWSHLPDDVLKHIFGQLQPASLRGIRLVCTAWHRTVSRFIVSLQPESFRGTALLHRDCSPLGYMTAQGLS